MQPVLSGKAYLTEAYAVQQSGFKEWLQICRCQRHTYAVRRRHWRPGTAPSRTVTKERTFLGLAKVTGNNAFWHKPEVPPAVAQLRGTPT